MACCRLKNCLIGYATRAQIRVDAGGLLIASIMLKFCPTYVFLQQEMLKYINRHYHEDTKILQSTSDILMIHGGQPTLGLY